MSEIDSQERINTTPLSAYNGHNKICRSGERVNFEEMDIGSSTPKSTLSSLHETCIEVLSHHTLLYKTCNGFNNMLIVYELMVIVLDLL